MKHLLRFALGFAATTAIVIPFTITAASAQGFPFEELDLTDEQQEQVQDIFQDLRSDVDEILTDEQQAQFQEAYQESQNFREAASAIEDLTDNQKNELRAAMQGSREEIGEVLTEEQLDELRSLRQERRQNRR